jgi:PST family polysaccharide transporter
LDETTPVDEIRHAAATGAAWSLFQSWGARLVSTATFFVLARNLDPKDFGVVALAVIFIDLGQMLIKRGFSASIVQRQDLIDEDLDSAFWFSVALGVVMMAAFVLAAGPIADAFDEPQLAPVLRLLSLNYVLGALSVVPQSVLQRQMKFRSLALRRLVTVVVSGIVGVVLALAGADVWSLVAMALVESVVAAVVLWSVSEWRPRMRVSRSRLRGMRRFAASVIAIDLLRFVAVRGEGFLIAATVSSLALGFYSVATRFLLLLNEVLTSTIGSVTFPVFSRLQDDPERRERALLSVVRMTSLAVFPAFAGLAVLAPEIIHTTLGARWDPAVLLTQLLALHGLRYGISFFISNVVLSTGNAGLELRLTIVGVCVKSIALAIGLQWGVVGMTWAVVISSWAGMPLGLWALRRTTGIRSRDYLRQLVGPALAALAMIAVVTAVRPLFDGIGDTAVLVGCTLIGGATYVATIGIVAPRLFAEVRDILGDIRRRPAKVTSTVPS